MNVALAIDVGSSSLRAALVDTHGDLVPDTLTQVDVELTIAAGGLAQINTSDVCEELEQALDRTPAAGGAAEDATIVVVAMTTFWHSLVVLDGSGEPRPPVLTWADTRSEAEAAELRERLDAEAV